MTPHGQAFLPTTENEVKDNIEGHLEEDQKWTYLKRLVWT
jgi:hypothetical protein